MKYAPDALPGTPGIIRSGNGFAPTGRGYANMANLLRYGGSSGWSGLGGTPTMLWSNNYEGDGRLLAATDRVIYELGITTFNTFTTTAVSPSLQPPSYTSDYRNEESDPDTFAFCNRGKFVYATNKFIGCVYKQADNGSQFTQIAGSPAAGAITFWKNFLICGNIAPGPYGAVTGTSDMVAWSGISDDTTFVPDSATSAGNQQLVDIPGRIVAMMPIGDALAIYKADAIYLMWYVGTDTAVFSFQLVDGERGINASPGYPPAIVDIGKGHLFVGRNDIFIFNGTTVKSIAVDRVRRTILENNPSAGGVLEGTHISYDAFNGWVIFWNYGMVYSTVYDEWGALPTAWTSAPVTAACYGNAWWVDYGAARGTINNVATMVAKSDGYLYNYWGAFYGQAVAASYADMVLEFSEIGANDFTSTLRRVFLVFSGTNPTSSPALAYSRKVALGSTASSDGTGTWNSATACFDLMKNAYWHVLSLTISSSEQEELVGMQFDLVPAGKRTETALQPLP